MRTKPTMFQSMLRSVLVTALSAGLVVGAVSALDLSWDSAPADATRTVAAPPDLAWSVVPAGDEA
ncbi:hypothetical protein AT728_33515 [Streptomyces silvensis]|uniref:Uncharacterized protein n=1 Tax=Streptomyces silvensis TaxID=1765722 RepID=A0A0W7WS15_9ACTN|nr:hypothetical protein AT728_33515 [Streptomyces silvensis]